MARTKSKSTNGMHQKSKQIKLKTENKLIKSISIDQVKNHCNRIMRTQPTRPQKFSAVGTVAPISKKSTAGSTGKSGAGFVAAKSGKPGSIGSSGKANNMFGSGPKTKTNSSLGASGKSSFGVSGKTSSSPTNVSAKTPSFMPLGGSGKASSPSYMPSGGKASSPSYKSSEGIGKTISPSFMPLGGSVKPSSSDKDKKSSMPLLLGGKSTSSFASGPHNSYPSTSFTKPKKSSTSFGIIWIPGRKNRKKEYVHVAHRDDGHARSPSMYPSEFNYNMSGDSPSHQPFKKKEEENNLLVLERPKGPIATAASAGTAVVLLDDKPPIAPDGGDPSNQEDKDKDKDKHEKSEFIRCEKEEKKDAAGDGHFDDKDNKSFLDNDTDSSKAPDSKTGKEKGDKVDSVYLRPPPPHKVHSTSSNEDDDCGIKCLYYTLQCCDCVLM